MKRFKNILYVNESAADQASAIARAVALAINNQAELSVVDVIQTPAVTSGLGLPPKESGSADLEAAIIADRRSVLESMIQGHIQHLNIQVHVLVGKTFLEVIRAVLRHAYDLVIKPAENLTWARRLFGSDDLHLLRKCPCPVWLMKPPEKSNYQRVLAAVGFDPLNPAPIDRELNREILELASSLALSDSASLHLVHAWDALAEKTMMSRSGMSAEGAIGYVERELELHRTELYRLGQDLSKSIGKDAYDYLSPSFHLPKGPAKKVIATLVDELRADIVVMGTVARTGIAGLIIGNTAEAIIDQLSCSVLAVKPPGFQTPVKIES
jgi:nucleotide-binding universal stress UspA family protein